MVWNLPRALTNALADPMATALSKSIWTRGVASPPHIERLSSNVHADVCVVGAGIAGLSVALCLLEQRRSVIVLDREGVGEGETLRTSAHLASALDDRYAELERLHGEEGAKLAAESHRAAINQIERWVREHAIDCDFQRVEGYLFRAPESHEKILDDEYVAARRAGLAVELYPTGAPGLGHYGPALCFWDQARIQPRDYLFALAEVVRRAGARLFKANVVSIDDGAETCVHTQEGIEVHAGAVVVATNVPFHRRVALHTKQAAYRTFVIAARVPRGAVSDALYWDTGDPYHYVRCLSGGKDADWDYLIVGGEDCKTGQPDEEEKPFDALTSWGQSFCSSFGAPEYAWSGQILEPVDGLAFIGADRGAKNIFVATGDSGNGLTHGTLAGPLLAALIHGEDHPWRSLYDPSRKRLNGTWLEENASVALQYRDWLSSGDTESGARIPTGEGAVVRHGLHRLALYRSNDSVLHAFSARCPHLGCSVRWNAIEKSWDCPCHGSRFAALDGHVLNGPALSGLERADDTLSPSDRE
jgi:glycine/D-amino acid oxidase-like deaminating enzyme/nitrite reductase/ring-hydroxylating ferredoxin subunit